MTCSTEFRWIRRERPLGIARVPCAAAAVVTLVGCGSNGVDGSTGPEQPTLASVDVTPSPVRINHIGEVVQLAAIARSASGAAISGHAFTWRSSREEVATVDEVGAVTGVTEGVTDVSATTGGVSGSVEVTVEQIAVRMEVEPDILTLSISETAALSAELQDIGGTALRNASIAWTSSDEGVVEVDVAGVVIAKALGEATVTAEGDGFSASVGVAVGPVFWELAGLTGEVISTVVVAPGSGDLFASTVGSGVQSSTDGGDSWSTASSGLIDNRIYALVATSTDDLFASGLETVFRSTDTGGTWTEVTGAVQGSIRGLGVGSEDEVYVASSFGLYVSTDNGDTFGLTTYQDDVDRVAVNLTGDIFVGTELDGIFRSTDGGATWDRLDVPGAQVVALALAVDPATGDVFLCCGGAVYRSTDNGDTWLDVTNDLAHAPFAFAFTSTGDVYAGTCTGGVYRSIDRGASWVPVNAGLPSVGIFTLAVDAADRVFAGTAEDGVVRTVEPKETTVGPRSQRECNLG